ncbi:MAG: DivIVA domain-containing protein, partial [Acidimicrobiia bacterium]|nr:DivIVA domain-containing protein [Acidimicrobiia bacterium]
MSLINRHRAAPGETPEQTLARLDAASRNAARRASDESRKPRFKVRYIAETYDIAEVDTFIDSIDGRTADEIRKVHFRTVILRGYDKAKVDQILDEHEARLNPSAKPTKPSRPIPTMPVELTPDERS